MMDKPPENLLTNLSSRPSSSAGLLSEVMTICFFSDIIELNMLKKKAEVAFLPFKNCISSINNISMDLKYCLNESASEFPVAYFTNSSMN